MSVRLLGVIGLIIPGIAIFLQFYHSDILTDFTEENEAGLAEIHEGLLLVLLSLAFFIGSAIPVSLNIMDIIIVTPLNLNHASITSMLLGFIFLLVGTLYPYMRPGRQESVIRTSNSIVRLVLFLISTIFIYAVISGLGMPQVGSVILLLCIILIPILLVYTDIWSFIGEE
jgi:hypothetical protein